MSQQLIEQRRAPGGCYCDDLRKDGTCKSCGARNTKITLPGMTATSLISEVGDYIQQERERQDEQRRNRK